MKSKLIKILTGTALLMPCASTAVFADSPADGLNTGYTTETEDPEYGIDTGYAWWDPSNTVKRKINREDPGYVCEQADNFLVPNDAVVQGKEGVHWYIDKNGVLNFQAGILEEKERYDFQKHLQNITAIKIIPYEGFSKLILPPDSSNLFWNSEASSIETDKMDTSRVTNMTGLFADNPNVTELDLSGFDTSNVTEMNCLFINCKKIERLYLRSFDTSNVKSMYRMFEGCESLVDVDLSSFNTGSLTDVKGMFEGCRSLTILDLSNFDTSNVHDMVKMFMNCSSLRVLDIGNFSTRRLCTDFQMFDGTDELDEINLSESMFIDGLSEKALPKNDNAKWEHIDDPTNRKTWAEMRKSWSAEDAGWRKADRKNCILHLDTSGGKEMAVKHYKKGSTVDITGYTPVKAGHDFTGWYTDSECTTKADSQIQLNADTTLYAGWQAQKRTLQFDSSGGSEIAPVTADYGSTIDLKNYVPEKEGYTFTGWYNDQDNTKKANDQYILKQDGSLYAGWEKLNPVVTLISNGGTEFEPLEGEYGRTVDLDAYIPQKEGCNFVDWYTDAECTTHAGHQIKVNAHTTLYAKWKLKRYKVFFNTNGGSNMNTLKEEYLSTVDLEKYIPAKEGYAFTGWYTDPECTTKADSQMTLLGETTLYAGWQSESSGE
ncbi:MAG: InlB B-repeat-containing protein [Erysipelotrichaceae bacterium]|nr:InlB B-repeat-containing protein [Erysipelotrichaceae bacterium]